MGEVWYAIPSANLERQNKTLPLWRDRGYKLALWIDPGQEHYPADIVIDLPYRGYYVAFNELCKAIGDRADIVVTGGDDVDPDPEHTAEQGAAIFRERFPDLCGVMEPVGDPWHSKVCCIAPWVGKGWIQRAYQGHGPVHPEYLSYCGDVELFRVAQRLDRLHLEPGITQLHHHWSRGSESSFWWRKSYHQVAKQNHRRDQELLTARDAAGFPGSELVP